MTHTSKCIKINESDILLLLPPEVVCQLKISTYIVQYLTNHKSPKLSCFSEPTNSQEQIQVLPTDFVEVTEEATATTDMTGGQGTAGVSSFSEKQTPEPLPARGDGPHIIPKVS